MLEEDDSRLRRRRSAFAVRDRHRHRSSRLVNNWSTIAITTEVMVVSRMDCIVAKTKSTSLCWDII
jgi:hypothetical protein